MIADCGPPRRVNFGEVGPLFLIREAALGDLRSFDVAQDRCATRCGKSSLEPAVIADTMQFRKKWFDYAHHPV